MIWFKRLSKVCLVHAYDHYDRDHHYHKDDNHDNNDRDDHDDDKDSDDHVVQNNLDDNGLGDDDYCNYHNDDYKTKTNFSLPYLTTVA